MQTKAGTPYYISPEVLSGSYDETCDIWSAGVLLYIILCGYPPFYGETDNDILEAVKRQTFNFDGPEWMGVSKESKDLISQMITKPHLRLTAQQILEHPWMKMDGSDEVPLHLNYKKMKGWKNMEKLKKIALTVIAS